MAGKWLAHYRFILLECVFMARRSTGEGTAAKQRYDGMWYRAIRIEGENKRKYVYAKTKAEVNKKCKELVKQLASGTYVEAPKQTVEAYMMNWLTTYKRVELKPKFQEQAVFRGPPR